MAAKRLFTGVGLPDAYQDGLRELAARWRPRLASRTTWTRPGNWHVTLKFLGDVDEEAVPEVLGALEAVAFAPFVMRAGGAGFFPPRGAPRVCWVGLAQGARGLGELAGAVERALAPLGFAPEERPYRPHLTLARVRRAGRDPWGELLADVGQKKWPAFTARAFSIWESVLGHGGPTYRVLADYGTTSL